MEQKVKCLYYIKDLREERIIYIGQTKDFKQRKYNHFGHRTTPIDAYMFEEGRDNFSMEIFENIDVNDYSDDDLRNKEQELIEYYDTITNGLNKLRSGNIEKGDIKKYMKEYMREYHQKSEKYKQYRKDYKREYNKSEKYKQYKREYYKKHKQQWREYSRQYYVRKKQEKLAKSESL